MCCLHLCFVCALLLNFNVFFTRGHVTLTYPPARKYSLDGTPAQKSGCGWEKGSGPKTTFLAGSMINITWQSSFSHKGGFKLEMLDPLERPLMDLTPIVRGEKYLNLDSRVQNYEVRLPKDFECTECTIRLLRRANEWDENFAFVSCADVDVTRNGRENCLARGSILEESSPSCVCNKPYEGHRCQNENECVHDADCGINGHCVDIGGLTYPKKQCFCNAGWFGKHCEKESVLKSTNINFSLYSQQELLPDVHLYWQLHLQQGEIEIFLVTKSTSYVALGWRPTNITAECKTKHLPNNDQRKPKQLTNEISMSTSTETEPSSSSTTTFSPIETTPSKKFQRVRFPSRKPQQPASTQTSISTTTSTTTTTTTTPSPSTLTQMTSITMESSSSSVEISKSPIANPIFSKSVSTSVEMSSSSSESMSEEQLIGSSAGTVSVTVPPTTISKEFTEVGHVTVTDVQIKSYTPDGDRKKRNIDSKIPIVPINILHPMDCVDMVVGSAKGEFGRVRDYYSRDQSTPQPDAFWDGIDDLTAAIAFESNGVTTVGFRRKLKSDDMTDHSIDDQVMSVIWARGQEVEDEFYTKDEFKYHGGGRHQRGTSTVQFFQEISKEVHENKEVIVTTEIKETMQETMQETPTFYGEWKRPMTCSIDNCEYRVTWTFDPKTDDIAFTVFTKHRNSWTGIGFSKDRFMNNTDVVIGWVNDDGRYFMMDMWINGYSAPLLDGVQNIDNQSGVRNDSGTTLMFSRKRDTGDELMDLKFEDDQCLYMIFPYNGGHYNPVNKKLKKHESTPAVSSEKICIRSQNVYTVPVSELPTTTTEVTSTSLEMTSSSQPSVVKSPAYVTIFRIPIEEPLQRTLESNSDSVLMALEEKIRVDMTTTLQNASGFEGVEVVKLERDSNTSDWLIATMHVVVDKSVEGNPNGGAVKKAIAQSIATGSIGNLNIDKNFLIIEVPKELEIDDDIPPPVISRVKSGTDGHLVAIYAVIAAVCALGILFFIQIICSITRNRNARQTRISKEQLITNSGWKDYSTNTSANYNYEPFTTVDGEGANPRKKKPYPEERIAKNGATKTSLSKQGPNPYQHPGNSRRSESLPRFTAPQHSQSTAFNNTNAYATHQRGQRESGGVSPARFGRDLQPDFYFMPSQRRYTGDVIRVSVDYNNPNYTGSK